MTDVTVLPETDVQNLILKLMRDTISDKEGNIDPAYTNMFENFEHDEEGFPYLQTLAGIVTIMPETPNVLNYSANYGYNAEQISVETRNLAKLAFTCGWDINISAGHFITPEQKLIMGDEGYRAHRFYVEQGIIQQIRRAAEQSRQQSTAPEILNASGTPVKQTHPGKIIIPN